MGADLVATWPLLTGAPNIDGLQRDLQLFSKLRRGTPFGNAFFFNWFSLHWVTFLKHEQVVTQPFDSIDCSTIERS